MGSSLDNFTCSYVESRENTRGRGVSRMKIEHGRWKRSRDIIYPKHTEMNLRCTCPFHFCHTFFYDKTKTLAQATETRCCSTGGRVQSTHANKLERVETERARARRANSGLVVSYQYGYGVAYTCACLPMLFGNCG
jgi:hypothetical protein